VCVSLGLRSWIFDRNKVAWTFRFRIMEPYDVIVNQPVVIDNVSTRCPVPSPVQEASDMSNFNVDRQRRRCRLKEHERLSSHSYYRLRLLIPIPISIPVHK